MKSFDKKEMYVHVASTLFKRQVKGMSNLNRNSTPCLEILFRSAQADEEFF